jgi:phage gp36-like protein
MTDMLTLKKLAELSNEKTPTVVDEVIVQQLIDDMSSDIDNYLRNRYPLPLTSTPPVIKRICKVLTRIQLYRGRPKGIDMEELRKQEEAARKELEQISKGTIQLELAGFTPEVSNPGRYASKSASKVFTDSFMDVMI